MPNPWNQFGDAERQDPEQSTPLDPTIKKPANWWEDGNPSREDSELHVLELLQRLEGETKPTGQARREPIDHPTKWAQWEPEVVCSECQYLNSADQRFCGYCGTPLHTGRTPVERAQAPAAEQPPLLFDEEPKAEPKEQPTLEPLIPSQSRALREKDDTDLEFLRNKTAGAAESPSRLKYAALAAVLILAAVAGYRWYSGMSLLPFPSAASTSKPATPDEGSAAPTQQTQSSIDTSTTRLPNSAATVPESRRTAAAPNPPATKASAGNAVPSHSAFARGVTPATQQSREIPAKVPQVSPSATTASTGPMGGGPELTQAERYLSPVNGSRDASEAAKWLWKSVSKENSRAVLLLSDLYAKGDGVPKSCDQARLLLTVAAKKGNTDAANRLQIFDSTGCQ